MKKILFTFLLFLVISNFNSFESSAAEYKTSYYYDDGDDGKPKDLTSIFNSICKRNFFTTYPDYKYFAMSEYNSSGDKMLDVCFFFAYPELTPDESLTHVYRFPSYGSYINDTYKYNKLTNTFSTVPIKYMSVRIFFKSNGSIYIADSYDYVNYISSFYYSKLSGTPIVNKLESCNLPFYNITTTSNLNVSDTIKQGIVSGTNIANSDDVINADLHLPDGLDDSEVDDGVSIGEINDLGSFLDALKTGFGLLGDNGIIAFLKDSMNYLPESIMLLIFSGVGAVVIVGLFKKLF